MKTKPKILTPTQDQFLELLGKQKSLTSSFYLSGGTALTEFYIPYRLSEDLDFFSEEEIAIDKVTAFIKSCKASLGYKNYSVNTSFNRNLFFLEFSGNEKILKVEFTYYPFPRIEKSKNYLGVPVDSVYDIAVNKLFTIYQQPRSRDFMDLYMILTKYDYKFEDILSKASAKFDWYIDPLKLGAQLLLAKEVKDYPRLLTELKDDDWISYFVDLAKRVSNKFTA